MKSSPTTTTLSLLYELAQRKDQVVFTFCVTTKKFDYINPIFESMWGRTRAGIIRNPTLLLKTVHPEDQGYVMECYEEIFEDKKKNVEFRILLPSKKERIVQVKTLRIKRNIMITCISSLLRKILYLKFLPMIWLVP
jgi:two-component system sensor histidine kinase VicK